MNQEKSTAVIYSFKEKWRQPLEKGEVSVFFRKRPPKAKCDRVYLYIGSPASSIIGWAPVSEIRISSPASALEFVQQGKIELQELKEYLKGSKEVGLIFIGKPFLFEKPIGVSEIRKIFNFYPPQNFVRVPQEACEMLEKFE
jgi:predicted transcriptional regulator